MATLPKTNTITYEEWLRMPEPNSREEVVDGLIQTMPPARALHARVVSRLVASIQRQVDLSRVEVFFGSYGLISCNEPFTCREPDVAMFERSTEIEIDGYF